MESKGTVFKILPAITGTSQKSGQPWMAQSFVIEVSYGDHGQYKRKQVFEIFGEDRIKEAQLSEGLTVKVSFDLEAREYEGRWYNSTRVWKVEHIMPQQGYRQQMQYPQAQRPPQNGYFQPVQQGYPQPTPYFQPQLQQGSYPPPYPPQGGGADELPF
jgi:hypothetical protein